MNNKSTGFSLVEILLVVAVVALLGFIGFRVWDANSGQNNRPAATTTQEDGSRDDAPVINDASDLDKANRALDETDVEGNSSTQLESEVAY